MMIQRLRLGLRGEHEQRFYAHELKEMELIAQGLGGREAHLETLRWQGIVYEPGYEAQLYHPEVIRRYPKHFSPAAQAAAEKEV